VAARQEEARIDVQRATEGPPLQLLLTDESKRQNGYNYRFGFPFARCSPFSLKHRLTSSKCSTYKYKALRRNVFTHLKQVATVRPFAAKLLSGKTLTSRKSTLRWGCRSSIANYIVA
jgi:hypothetical protein